MAFALSYVYFNYVGSRLFKVLVVASGADRGCSRDVVHGSIEVIQRVEDQKFVESQRSEYKCEDVSVGVKDSAMEQA